MKTLIALLLAALPLFAHAQYGATYTQRPAGGGCTAGSACTGTTITATTGVVTPLLSVAGSSTNNLALSSDVFTFKSNSQNIATINYTSGLKLNRDSYFGWNSTADSTATLDLVLTRSAAAILAITGDGTGTASGQVGWAVGNYSGITAGFWASNANRGSAGTYTIVSNGSLSQFNGASGVNINVNDVAKMAFTSTAGAGPAITAGTAATASMFATSWTQTRNYSAAATDYLSATFTTTGGGTATHASDNLLNLKTGASGAEVSAFSIGLLGNVTLTNTIKLMGYTVAGLPAAGTTGRIAYVTNQLTACVVPGAAITGGGALVCPVFDNGVAWVGM